MYWNEAPSLCLVLGTSTYCWKLTANANLRFRALRTVRYACYPQHTSSLKCNAFCWFNKMLCIWTAEPTIFIRIKEIICVIVTWKLHLLSSVWKLLCLDSYFGIWKYWRENQVEDKIPRTYGSTMLLNRFLGWSVNTWLLSPTVEHGDEANASRCRNSADCNEKTKVACYQTVLFKTLQSPIK